METTENQQVMKQTMNITLQKTVSVTNPFRPTNLKLLMGGQKDVDSTNFEIYYNDIEIAFGHLNHKSNWAHVTMISSDNEELEDCLVELIENRKITIE